MASYYFGIVIIVWALTLVVALIPYAIIEFGPKLWRKWIEALSDQGVYCQVCCKHVEVDWAPVGIAYCTECYCRVE